MARIAVVGGSIAGCAAAVAARRTGHEVTVYERTESALSERGVGILIPSELYEQLIAAGYVDANLPVCRMTRLVWLLRDGDQPEGRTVARQPTAAVVNNWGLLWHRLRSRVPDDGYRAGVRVAAIDGCTLVLGDGSRERFDAVIGADGHRSLVRAAMHPGVEPVYAGYVLWRGTCEEAALSAGVVDILEGSGVGIGYPGGHAIFYLIPGREGEVSRGRRRLNFGVYATPPMGDLFDSELGYPPGSVTDDLMSFLSALVEAHFPALWAEAVRCIEPADLFVQPIHDLTIPSYVSEHALLAGDASTITRPHTGSGATKAIEDALCLERAGASGGSWASVLASYNAERCPIGNRLVGLGRRMGRALVEETPDWPKLKEGELVAWIRAAIEGHDSYLYRHVTNPSSR